MPIITTPGSKSITNRVLVLAALAKGKTVIKNAADCDDTKHLIIGLKKLGVKIIKNKSGLIIFGNNLKFPENIENRTINLNTGNAGTTTRFLTALGTIAGLKIKIDGDKRMRERPIKELINALNKLGAKIESTTGCPPLLINAQKLSGGECKLSGNISSQYLSAILMIAPFANNKTTINIEQELYSKPYIKMTLKVLKDFGIQVLNKKFKQFIVQGNQKIKNPKTYTIESDASSASYIGAYAALHRNKEVTLKNLPSNSLQGDMAFLNYLKKMGCKISNAKDTISIKGPKALKPLGEIDMNETPDLVMTFAVLALFTKGKTRITNIANLRIKETDRITALKNELEKFGAKVETTNDSIEIQSNRLILTHMSQANNKGGIPQAKPIKIHTYNDHRMAMSFGILKSTFPKLSIENPSCVSKSYTTFWNDLKKLTNE